MKQTDVCKGNAPGSVDSTGVMGRRAVVSLLILAAVPACGRADAPEVVVGTFLDHLAAGREAEGRALMVAAERDDPRWRFDAAQLKGGYELDPAAPPAGDTAQVTVRGKAKGASALVVVLCREGGRWRISMEQTMQVALGDRLQRLKDGLRDIERRFREDQAKKAGAATPR